MHAHSKKDAPTAKQLAEAVIALRQEKLPDPLKVPNAGSFFKNPSLEENAFGTLQKKMPFLRAFPSHQTGFVKLSAAQLIESCGWKGYAKQGVGVYDRHALVLVHHGSGQASTFLALVKDIQESVRTRFGISLVPEVRIV